MKEKETVVINDPHMCCHSFVCRLPGGFELHVYCAQKPEGEFKKLLGTPYVMKGNSLVTTKKPLRTYGGAWREHAEDFMIQPPEWMDDFYRAGIRRFIDEPLEDFIETWKTLAGSDDDEAVPEAVAEAVKVIKAAPKGKPLPKEASNVLSDLSSVALRNLAKERKVTHWQWANKDNLITLIEATDPAKVKAAQQEIEDRYQKWASQAKAAASRKKALKAQGGK